MRFVHRIGAVALFRSCLESPFSSHVSLSPPVLWGPLLGVCFNDVIGRPPGVQGDRRPPATLHCLTTPASSFPKVWGRLALAFIYYVWSVRDEVAGPWKGGVGETTSVPIGFGAAMHSHSAPWCRCEPVSLSVGLPLASLAFISVTVFIQADRLEQSMRVL